MPPVRNRKSLEPWRRRTIPALLLVVALALMPTDSALAAFPGVNGKIVFSSNRDGNFEIYVIDTNGSNPTRLTDNAVEDREANWSPDGNRIVFRSARDGNSEIYVMNADGGSPIRLTNDSAFDGQPSWSPDGGRITFVSARDGNQEIYVMNADGTGQTRITTNTAPDFEPAWSPDGTRIAFTSDRSGGFSIFGVYVMDAAGTNPVLLAGSTLVASAFAPAWSANGVRIVFHAEKLVANPGLQVVFEIRAINPNGTGNDVITANPWSDDNAAWSPDGNSITFGSNRDGNAEIYAMNSDGTGQTRLTVHAASDLEPDWQPINGNAPSIVQSVVGFEGSSQLNGGGFGFGVTPPDTMGAVGLSEFMEFNNQNVSVYSKLTGTLQSRVDLQTFWQRAGIPSADGFHSLGDQRVLFDRYTQRWIATSFGGTPDKVNIAVSDTHEPLGTWRGVQYGGVAAGNIADFPTLGLDREGVYVGTTNFSASGLFIGATLSVIPRSDLFGGSPTLTRKTSFSNPGGLQPLVIQGAVNWNSVGNRGQFIASQANAIGLLRFEVNGVESAGATVGTTNFVVGRPYSLFNSPGRQPDGTRLILEVDDRPSNNVVQVGDRIFVTSTVTRQPPPFQYQFTSVNWKVIDATSGTLIEEGDIGGGGFDYYQGSIAVNPFGQAVIGYNRSGPQTTDANGDGKPDGRITFMAQTLVTDAGGGMDPAGDPLILRVSDVSDYRCGARTVVSTTCLTRWGDTSAVTIDPTNPHIFYAIGEYAGPWAIYPSQLERSVWQTYVAAIRVVPEPKLGILLMPSIGLIGWFERRRRTRAPDCSAPPREPADRRGSTGSPLIQSPNAPC